MITKKNTNMKINFFLNIYNKKYICPSKGRSESSILIILGKNLTPTQNNILYKIFIE